MNLPCFNYFEPKSIEETSKLLSQEGKESKILAGGSDLLVMMKEKAVKYSSLINIKYLPKLNLIEDGGENGLQIGALTTLKEIEDSPIIKERFNILVQAAHAVGSPQIRNIATIGGNICQDAKCCYYRYSKLLREELYCFRKGGDRCYIMKGGKGCYALSLSDLAPALIVLDAKVKVVNHKGEKVIAIEKLFESPSRTILGPEEFITQIIIPPLSPFHEGVYLKYRLRKAMDFGLLGVAVVMGREDNTCSNLKIAIGAAAPTPLRLREAEEVLKGKEITGGLIEEVSEAASKEAHCFPDFYLSAPYRKEMVKVFTRRAIEAIIEGGKV